MHMESEEWLPVVGFVGYEVSSLGRVRRGARIRKATPDGDGYPRVSFWVDGRAKKVAVHKLVAAAFLGPRPRGLVIRHLDGKNSDPSLGNLAYGTPLENEADKAEHGTKVVGTKHHSNKLTEAQVAEIRRRHVPRDPDHGLSALARELSVSVKTVQRIVKREIWKHVA